MAAEKKLGKLIAHIGSTQSAYLQQSDPVRQWEDLRSTSWGMGWVQEVFHRDEIEKVRVEAERLWSTATSEFDLAEQTEANARAAAVTALRAAHRMVPDFRANSGDAARVIAATPGLAAEIDQAEHDSNARTPGRALLEAFQVADEERNVLYPGTGWQGRLARSFGIGSNSITKTEANLLDSLSLWQLRRFLQIHDEAISLADEHFDRPRNPNCTARDSDGHNDAFRHAYWTAMLIREFGEDWAMRYTTATREAGRHRRGGCCGRSAVVDVHP